jgi:hypothetical protein
MLAMDVQWLWYDYAGNVDTLVLQQHSTPRDLLRAIWIKHKELSTATILIVSHQGQPLGNFDELDTVQTSRDNPIQVGAKPRMRVVWYFIAGIRADYSPDQTWVPMASDVDDLRETILSENSDYLVGISADQLEIYIETGKRESTDPLSGDRLLIGLGSSHWHDLYVVPVPKARAASCMVLRNPLQRLKAHLDMITSRLSTVYEFDNNSTASIDNIILSMDGYWKYVIADKTEVRQKGVDGPKYMVMRGFPLTGMRLNEVYTREEWDILGLASLVLRNEKTQIKYLKQGLLDAVEAIANKEYWC